MGSSCHGGGDQAGAQDQRERREGRGREGAHLLRVVRRREGERERSRGQQEAIMAGPDPTSFVVVGSPRANLADLNKSVINGVLRSQKWLEESPRSEARPPLRLGARFCLPLPAWLSVQTTKTKSYEREFPATQEDHD